VRVSVVIPALNEEAAIEECLRAVRAQTLPVELIVVDNGSEDRTPEIASEYCDKVLVMPGASLATLRDAGAKASCGDIIVTTDADCVPPPHWLERLVEPFQDPRVVAVGGAFKPLNVNPFSRFYCWCSSITQGVLGLFQGANMAYRREAYLRSPGYTGAKRAEYPGGIVSALLSVLGALMGLPLLMGLGAGYVGSEMLTFLVRQRSNLRLSHVTLLAMVVVYFSRRFLNAFSWNLALGVLVGVFGYQVIAQDIRLAIEDLKMFKTRGAPEKTIWDRLRNVLELGLGGLPGWACEAAKSPETRITMVLEVEGLSFSCTGRGDPGLTYTHPRDMVARRSSYTCGRTLMVGADKAAVDLPREMLEALRRGAPVEVGLLYRV